ncbi:MAG: RcnB family protein, partial [Sphingomonadales bacterium]|nr:RcnB family protein [Sphingomonadales bacterium]
RPPAPTVQNVPVRPSQTSRDWTDRRPTRLDAPGSGGNWNRGDDGGRRTPPVATPPATPQPAVRPDRGPETQRNWAGDDNGRRGNWDRGNDNRGGRDWNHGEDNRGDRNWRRDNDNRAPDRDRDGNRWQNGNGRDNNWRNDNRWNSNDRNDWNRQREWNNQRRLQERERWSDWRRWDNGWRSDRRYDWHGYRTQYRSIYHLPSYRAPYGWSYGYRRFSIGIFLSNVLFSSSYWIDDPYRYRLPPVYGPLRWVRYYDDALLVDIRDGYVVDVIHDFFW